MRKISLKLKMHRGMVGIFDGNLEKRLLYLILMALGVLSLCYVFILGNMVFNIVERKALEKEALALSNEVGSLELSYLSLSSKIDLNLSYSLGFKEIKPKFAIRRSLGLGPTSLNFKIENEI